MTRRDEILAVSSRLLLEVGLPGLSMRRIAADVGVSATALYRHFASKGEIVAALIDEARDLLLARMAAGADRSRPPRALDAALEGYLSFALEERRWFEILFMTPRSWSRDRIPVSYARTPPPPFRHLVERVKACIASGDLPPGDATEVAIDVWAHGHGLVTLYHAGRLGSDEAAFRTRFRRSMRRLLRGLVHDRPRKDDAGPGREVLVSGPAGPGSNRGGPR